MNNIRKIYYTEGYWSVRKYWHNGGVVQLCHKHANGTTYIIPFGYSRDTKGKCSNCNTRAPQGARMSWMFLNWNRFNE